MTVAPTRRTLDNGLDILVQPHASPLAAVWLWLEAGTVDESEDAAGVAHFLEHLVFKGTERRGIGAAAADVEALGGDLNAFTSHEETVLHATVDATDWEGVLDVIADMVRFPRLDPAELERERFVVLDEIRSYDDDPETVVQDVLHAALYPGHAYGRPVLGTVASVKKLRETDVREFWSQNWTPNRARLVLVGPVDPKHVEDVAKKHLGGWARGAERKPIPSPAAAPHGHIVRGKSGFDSTVVHMAWRTPGIGHPDAAALDVLAAALGEGQASLLQDELHLDRDVATDSWADHSPMTQGGSLSLGFLPMEGRTLAAAETALDVVRRVVRQGLSISQIDRARGVLQHDSLFDDETVEGVADNSAWYVARTGHLDGRFRWRRAIAEVSPSDIRRVARTYMDPAATTLAFLDGGLSRRDVDRLTALPGQHVAPTQLRPSHEPTRFTLDNGARLVVLPSGGEVAGLAITALGGGLLEEPRSSGIGQAWSHLLQYGAGDYDVNGFGDAVDAAGLVLDPAAGRGGVQIAASFPVDASIDALHLIGAVLADPHFEAEDVARITNELKEDLDTLPDRPQQVVQTTCWEMLFPGHPWRLSPLGTYKSLKAIDPAGIRKFHKRNLVANNVVVAVAGGVEPDAVLDVLGPWLNKLPTGAPPTVQTPHQAIGVAPRLVSAGHEQAYVQFAWQGLCWSDPERYALAIATSILGSQSGRMFMELRERRALGYAVWANSWEGPVGGIVMTGLATDTHRVEEAREALNDVVQGLLSQPPDPAEIHRARRATLTAIATGQQRAVGRALDLAMADRFDLPYGIEATRQGLDAVTVAAVTDVWAALGAPVEVIATPLRR